MIDKNNCIVPPNYLNKVVRTISEERARKHFYYNEKAERCWFNKESCQDSKRSITKKVLGVDLKILAVGLDSVKVRYNLERKGHTFYIKLCEWAVDYVYDPKNDPEYYI